MYIINSLTCSFYLNSTFNALFGDTQLDCYKLVLVRGSQPRPDPLGVDSDPIGP